MCEYLQRRQSRYYFRSRVPLDLVEQVGYRIYQRAIGTADPVLARRLCRTLAVELDSQWDALREAAGAKPSLSIAIDTKPLTSAPRLVRKVQQPAEERTVEFDSVIASWESERKPLSQTVGRLRGVVRDFKQVCKVTDMAKVTRRDVLHYKDWMLTNGFSAANTNNRLMVLGVIFSYAHLNDLIVINPSSRVRVEDKRKAVEKRLNFEEHHLKAIFSGPVHAEGLRPKSGGGDGAYWIPLLALYTGARLNELGQLRPQDVYEETYRDQAGQLQSAWVVRITSDEADGLTVKTSSSVRRVPVHTQLIKLGFIDYVKSASGRQRLFWEVKLDRDGKLTCTWSKWFINQYLRKTIGIKDSRLVFHSFRHTFKHMARLAGISKEVSDAITGHSSGDVASSYGGLSFPLAPLVDGVKRYNPLIF